MKKTTILFWCVLIATSINAKPIQYTIDPQFSQISYSVQHLGLSYQFGSFTNIEGKISFDDQNKQIEGEVIIKAESIKNNLKDPKNLLGKDFFDVENYPDIKFTPTQITTEENTITKLDGYLTLLGNTRPISLQVNYFKKAKHPESGENSIGINASTLIKRSDYGLDFGIDQGFIGDLVRIDIAVEAKNQTN